MELKIKEYRPLHHTWSTTHTHTHTQRMELKIKEYMPLHHTWSTTHTQRMALKIKEYRPLHHTWSTSRIFINPLCFVNTKRIRKHSQTHRHGCLSVITNPFLLKVCEPKGSHEWDKWQSSALCWCHCIITQYEGIALRHHITKTCSYWSFNYTIVIKKKKWQTSYIWKRI